MRIALLILLSLSACTGSSPTNGTLPSLDGSKLTNVSASTVGGVEATKVAASAKAFDEATDAATAAALVKRDASGNFSAGTISATLNGNAATATTASFAVGKRGTDLTAAAALALPSDGDFFRVAGTQTILTMSEKPPGAVVTLSFQSTITIHHSTTGLILAGNGDFKAHSGDLFQFVSEGSGTWRELSRRAAQDSAVSAIATTGSPAIPLGATNTELIFDQNIVDTQGEYTPGSLATTGSRFTPHQDGYYSVTATLITYAQMWAAADYCALNVIVNASADLYATRSYIGAAANIPCVATMARTIPLHAGDTLTFAGVSNVSSTASNGNGYISRVTIARVRDL